MKIKLLILPLLLSSFFSSATIFTVTNAGASFTPFTTTITFGDSVNFFISGSHDAREVSFATWTANGNTPLPGFQTPFGGGMVTPVFLTVGTHYYVCTPHAGIGMKGIIVVNPCVPPAMPGTISGNDTVCALSANFYSIASVTGATSYSWSLPAGWSGSSNSISISATSGSTGGTISVIANNSCGPSPAQSITVTVLSTPSQPGAIGGNDTVCTLSTNTYSITPVTGATFYNWTLPAGWSGTSSTNSISATANSSAGTITVSAGNSCGVSTAQSFNVSVKTIPAGPSGIVGNSAVCASGSNSYSVAAVSGATSYTWTLPAGWSGSSSTNSINTTAGASGGTISVTANNSCGNSAAQTLSVSVSTTAPAMPGPISGNNTVCDSSLNTYSVTPVTGATSYNWTLPAGWTGSSTTNSISAVAIGTSGNISVSAVNGCGVSAPQTLAVSVTSSTALPQPASISGAVLFCPGNIYQYIVPPVAGASGYQWTLLPGWTGTSTTDTINATTSASGGTISVSATNACGLSAPQNLTVLPDTASLFSGTISGNPNACSGSSNTYSVTVSPNAVSYSWTLPAGWSGSSTSNSINADAGLNGGTVSVHATNGCGVTETISITVGIIAVDTSVIVLGPNFHSFATGSTYQWVDCNGWTPITGATGQNFTAVSNGLYAVIVTKNGCSDTSNCRVIDFIGVDYIYSAPAIELVPNPATSMVNATVFSAMNFDAEIIVTDITGIVLKRMMFAMKAGSNIISLNVADLAKGFYLISITDKQSGSQAHKMLMKE